MPDGFLNGAAAADMARIFEPLAGRMPTTAAIREPGATVKSTDPNQRFIAFAAPALVIIAAVGSSIAYVASEGSIERGTAANTQLHTKPQQHPVPRKQISAEGSASSNQAQTLVLPRDESSPDKEVAEASISSARSPASATMPSERAAIMPRADAAGKSRVFKNPLPPRPGGAQKVLARHDGTANLPRCTPGSTEDRCIYQDVLNADARLRTAFDNAQRTGISNARLATIRARWDAARRDADDDPDGTIWQYNRLARALDRMARSETE